MNGKELTEWFPAGVKPMHAGCYQWSDRYGEPLVYSYHWWDGKDWVGSPGYTPADAENNKDDCGYDASYFEACCHSWRGLRSPA